MELFIVVTFGVVVSALLLREFGSKKHNAYGFASHESKSVRSTRNMPQNWMTNPAYYWMMGNIYYEDYLAGSASSQDNEDWLTDPCYSYLPGNIFHRDEPPSSCTCSGRDWMTDPCCSYMPGNIYHHDDTTTSSCTFSDSDWMTDPSCSYMPGNVYHEDDDNDHINSSNSSFSSDDAWSSTSITSCFDDSWSNSSSSFDDD